MTQNDLDPRSVAGWIVLSLVAVAVVLHALLPRYDWRLLQEPGKVSVVVYDKWTGRMQRAVYDDKGSLDVMRVYTPF